MSHIFSRNEPIQQEDEENIFDRYYSYIEELNTELSGSADSALTCLNNALIIAERNLTDLIYAFDVQDDKKTYVGHLIHGCLTAWYPIFETIAFLPSRVESLAYAVWGLALIPYQQKLESDLLHFFAMFIGPSIDFEDIEPSKQSVDESLAFKQARRAAYGQSYVKRDLNDGFEKIKSFVDYKFFSIEVADLSDPSNIDSLIDLSRQLNLSSLYRTFRRKTAEDIKEAWYLTIKMPEMEPLAVPFLELMYTLAAAIQSIDPEGIEISIYDWGTGSKWATLKIWFNSLLAKEETKEIFEKAKNAAYAELFDKRINDAELSRAESEKLKKEALQLPGATHIDEHHRLDLEMKRLAVAEKAMQLQEKAIDIKMKELDAVNKISELISKKVLNTGSTLEIQINNLLYYDTEAKNPDGEQLDIMDAKGALRPKKPSGEDAIDENSKRSL